MVAFTEEKKIKEQRPDWAFPLVSPTSLGFIGKAALRFKQLIDSQPATHLTPALLLPEELTELQG